jgi:hypothetical protein
MKFPNSNTSIFQAVENLKQNSTTLFVPSHIAFQDEDAQRFIHDSNGVNAYSNHVKLLQSAFVYPTIDNDLNFVIAQAPDIIRVLPPDHNTAKMVAADSAKVLPNSFATMQFLMLATEVETTGWRGGRHVKYKDCFTLDLDGKTVMPLGLNYNLDTMLAPLLSGTCIPLMNGAFIGDFSLVMTEQPGTPSSAQPFFIFPNEWINLLNIEQRDVGYEKQKALEPSSLRPGFWYALPAGRLGLFCGWYSDTMIWLEMTNGGGRTISDDTTESAVEAKLMGRYYWGGIKLKKITRNSYNKEIAKYTRDFDKVLEVCAREFGLKPLATKADAIAALAANISPPPTPDNF